jgi:tetratricopeptide (TPR) repeat protein
VGEAAAAGRPVDSPLKLSLSIAAERYLTLGDRAFRDGRYSDAVQFYAKAVEYSPNEGVLHLVLADALFATADYRYAAYSLRRALELDPALAGAVVDKHEFYADPADFDRHLAEAETFVANNPADSDARLVLAANFLFGNRPAAAVDLLESHSALSLRADTAATVILKTAREIQYGEPAKADTQE